MVNHDVFIELKKSALRIHFSKMNTEQQLAVFTVKGPLLILAGAGSGKTTVLVNRIANMIHFGNAYLSDYCPNNLNDSDIEFLKNYSNEPNEDRLAEIVAEPTKINPWNILAITFTNKAAGELRERLNTLLGDDARGITAATFHSACVRILRTEIEQLGYKKSFTIYDSDDSQRVIKTCLTNLGISDKQFPAKAVLSQISHAKDSMITPEEFEANTSNDYYKQVISKIYKAYQERLFAANAVDFDDIIRLTVELFSKFPQVLEHYQNLYKYIMVDEYQDTNHAQYKLVSMLSAKNKNICVVGDDDQSIYKFRGATIENILNFESQFDNCTTIRLEQNYRSTQNILSAANSVIANNKERKDKKLWTSSGDGEKVIIHKSTDELGETKYIAERILENIKNGGKYSDHAILYRMNAQSNMLERTFVQSGIPYRVIGGLRFYDRKEIKDMIAYFSVINNPADLLRLKRIINEPKRGIGDATVSAMEQISTELNITPLSVMRNAGEYPPLAKKSGGLISISKLFEELHAFSTANPLNDLLEEVMDKTGYRDYLKTMGEEGITRMENIEELKSSIITYSSESEEPTLGGFLEEISLYTDVDKLDAAADTVTMMTMHSAKGLEFPQVFIVGMEEGLFPSARSSENEADIEEERRLAYVAFTRAKERLYITHAAQRMIFGQTSRNAPSRFAREIDGNVLEKIDNSFKNTKASQMVKPYNAYSLQNQVATKKAEHAELAKQSIEFTVGDSVVHNIFGEGTVISVKKMSNDAMLEVAFEKVGTKKLMANFAKILKL